MEWTVWIAPRDRPTDLHKYEVSARSRYYAKIAATILYAREAKIVDKTPFQLIRDTLDLKVKCKTDGRLVDYSSLKREVTV